MNEKSSPENIDLHGKGIRQFLRFMGPGLITGASDDDPAGIATYSQAGAAYGYSMSWVMLLTYPLMSAIQEISARIGRVTGKGIAGNIRAHYSHYLLWPMINLLLAANIVNLAADLGAMGEALHLLTGGPAHLFVLLFAAGCAWLAVVSQYEKYVRILKWTARWPLMIWSRMCRRPMTRSSGSVRKPRTSPSRGSWSKTTLWRHWSHSGRRFSTLSATP
jgi:NRAMP (natural resistance-associated macrophage protein)-like metal ion transporter